MIIMGNNSSIQIIIRDNNIDEDHYPLNTNTIFNNNDRYKL